MSNGEYIASQLTTVTRGRRRDTGEGQIIFSGGILNSLDIVGKIYPVATLPLRVSYEQTTSVQRAKYLLSGRVTLYQMTGDAVSTEVEVCRHTDVEIPVGTETVAATRYEPTETDGPSPALLMYVPYPKDDIITYGAYDPLNLYLVRNGYEVVVADMIGTGASTGCFDTMFSSQEGEDAAAIVRWLADQEWTTGRVGMYGKSYGGYTALAAAAERPEALEAIVPVFTPYTGYRNGYTNGGLFELLYIGMDWLTLMQSLDVKPPSLRTAGSEWVKVWGQHLDSTSINKPWLFQFLDHDVKDDYWSGTDLEVSDIRTPTLAVGGWRDPYTPDTIDYYESIDAPKRLLLGPWRHRMPHRGRECAIEFRSDVCDWFDQFLRDEQRGVLDTPSVHAWTESDGGGIVDGGTWQGLDRWPTVDGVVPSRTFALAPDGVVQEAEFEDGRLEREYVPDYSVGMESIVPATMAVQPRDSTPDDNRSVSFESRPFDQPVEFTGTGMATVNVKTTIEDPTVSIRLIDVSPDGTSTMVTHGTRRLRCRDDLSSLREIPTGEPVSCTLQLNPVSHVFEAGHRLRIALAGSLFPTTMPTGSTGTLTFSSTPDEPTTVRLPGRPRTDDRTVAEIEKQPPDDSIPASSTRIRNADATWETIRGPETERATVRKTTAIDVDLPHADLSRTGSFEASIDPDDPDSLVASNELEWTLQYPRDTVRVVATNQFGRDFAEAETSVAFDDRVLFKREWQR